jgi:hypothetical protein
MRAIVTALNDVRIEPENETERIILLHWSKGKPRIQPTEGAEKDFVNLFMTFDRCRVDLQRSPLTPNEVLP